MPLASALPIRHWPAPVQGVVRRVLSIDRLERLYDDAARGDQPFFDELLRHLNVRTDVAASDLDRIPASGAAIVICNHPYGILDGVVLGQLLTGVRPDTRILTNRFLSELPALRDTCIFVDPFNLPEHRRANGVALKTAVEHLKRGGVLAIFPAGEVSHFDFKCRAVRDPEWNTVAARLARLSSAKVIPAFVLGSNGVPFQMLGMVHPRLRTAALPAELLNKRGGRVCVSFGRPVEAASLTKLTPQVATSYLRLRSDLLRRRYSAQPLAKNHQPTIPPVAPRLIESELAALPAEAHLIEAGEMSVCIAPQHLIPNTVREIGRLREITFRDAGEGTGKSFDLDRHDDHYLHLLVWNNKDRHIVGAYRLGRVPDLIARFGKRGLYTASLFRFAPGFLENLGPALEAGRSFIRREYQRQFAPLLLLWKGIGAYVAQNPEYKTVIGAVSVSNSYSKASRELIVRYFESKADPRRRSSVRARRPVRGAVLTASEQQLLCSVLDQADDLSAPIADIEPDGKGLPVLVRQYVNLGGELLAFSLDPHFSNALDGFVLVDLTRTEPSILARYMGLRAAEEFRNYHASPLPA